MLRVTTLCVLMICITGCRAIRRFGDSRQAIAARRLSGQGFEAMHDGQWEDAETLFTDALEVSKSDDRAHWGKAEASWQRGQTDLAIDHMKQAVRLSAGDPKYVRRLGRMYFDTGELEQADLHAKWALQSARDSAESWALRGDCLKAAGDDTAALAAYHRALAYQPDYPEVQMHAAEVYHDQSRFDRCLATIDRLHDGVGVEAADSDVDMLQGLAMRQLGRDEEAKRCFLRASKKSPNDSAPHFELASLGLKVGQIELARQSLEIAMRLDPASDRGGGLLDALLPNRVVQNDPLDPNFGPNDPPGTRVATEEPLFPY